MATVNLFCISRNQFLKDLCSGTQCIGFQFLLILFKSVLGQDKETRLKAKQKVFEIHIYL